MFQCFPQPSASGNIDTSKPIIFQRCPRHQSTIVLVYFTYLWLKFNILCILRHLKKRTIMDRSGDFIEPITIGVIKPKYTNSQYKIAAHITPNSEDYIKINAYRRPYRHLSSRRPLISKKEPKTFL